VEGRLSHRNHLQQFKALSYPLRPETLILLAEREFSVGELSEVECEKIGTVSARLKVLLTACLVMRRKKGQNASYSIADHACERHVMRSS
jgi:ArsR family transcriptional regulator